jgi:hypothetical protein
MMAPVKLLMTWDILPGQAQEYFEFIVREFLPGMQRLGVEPTDAWYTAYGQGPQIMVGGITSTLDSMTKFLDSTEWRDIVEQLMRYVENYTYKVINAGGGFQL